MCNLMIANEADIDQLKSFNLDTSFSITRVQERYIMAQFLHKTFSNVWHKFLMRLKHDDRPDFRLRLQNEKQTIGIEVTRACNEAQKQIQYRLSEASNQPYCYSTNAFKPSMSKAESKSLIGMVISNEDFPTCPLVGREPERRWVHYIKKISDKKKIDFNKKEFQKLDTNLLLISVETPGMVAVRDFEFCLAELEKTFIDYWKNLQTFDAIFIIHDDLLIKLDQYSASIH